MPVLNGKTTTAFPADLATLEQVEVIYETSRVGSPTSPRFAAGATCPAPKNAFSLRELSGIECRYIGVGRVRNIRRVVIVL